MSKDEEPESFDPAQPASMDPMIRIPVIVDRKSGLNIGMRFPVQDGESDLSVLHDYVKLEERSKEKGVSPSPSEGGEFVLPLFLHFECGCAAADVLVGCGI